MYPPVFRSMPRIAEYAEALNGRGSGEPPGIASARTILE
jgi:hypothetical protein